MSEQPPDGDATTPWTTLAILVIAVYRTRHSWEALMRLFVGSTVINTADIDRAIAFWTAALSYVVRDSDPTFAVLTDPDRRWSNVSLQRSDEPKRGRNRVHLDLYTSDRDGEVARLEGLGATRVPWEYEEGHDHIVMADHDGNEFCVVQSAFTQN